MAWETGKRPFFLWMNEWTQELIADVELLAEQLLKSEGMRLMDVEYGKEPKGWVLRVFIDKQGGVTIDDCADISNQLGDILDAKMDYEEPYYLEVSSPGIDRPLTKPKHFVYFEGRHIIIKTRYPVEGERDFRGILSGFSDGVVILTSGDRTLHISYENIAKARLDY